MNKKIYLLNLTPHKYNKLVLSFLIIFIFILPILSFVKIYDSYYTTGLISCDTECNITITLPYDKVNILSQEPRLSYLNNEYDILSLEYNEPYLDNQIPYEDIIIKTNLNSQEKIINFKILYNKQRVIKKIKKIIEGE